jgi:hypothetical protein
MNNRWLGGEAKGGSEQGDHSRKSGNWHVDHDKYYGSPAGVGEVIQYPNNRSISDTRFSVCGRIDASSWG